MAETENKLISQIVLPGDNTVYEFDATRVQGRVLLDSNGVIFSDYIPETPGQIDDIIEYDTREDFPATGQKGVIYYSKDDDEFWRWTGSTYAKLSIIREDIVTILDEECAKADHHHTYSKAPTSTGSKSLTPAGTIKTAESSTGNYTPKGTVAASFTGTQGTTGNNSASTSVASTSHTHTVTADGDVTIAVGTGTANYTPGGTITATFTGTQGTTGDNSASATVAGSAHTHTVSGVVTGVTAELTNGETGDYEPTANILGLNFAGSEGTTVAPVGTVKVGSEAHTHSYDKTTSITVAANASGNYTPAGTVSKPTFTGSSATTSEALTDIELPNEKHTHSFSSNSYTPAGTVSKPTFTGTSATTSAVSGTTGCISAASPAHTHKYTPSGTIKTGTGTANYTPSGSVSSHTHTMSCSPTTGSAVTSASFTQTYDETAKRLTLNFSATSANFVKSVGLSAKTGAATPTFTGTAVQLVFDGAEGTTGQGVGTVDVVNGSHKHTVTATGTVSQPTFTGTADVIEGFTIGVTEADDAFTAIEHTHTVTATGSVSQPTFTGTKVQISPTHTSTATAVPSATVSVANSTHTHKYTPAGTVSYTQIQFTPIAVDVTATTGNKTTGTPSATATVAKHTHTHTYTPSGSVGATLAGTPVHLAAEFEGASVTTSAPTGSTTVAKHTHTHTYTPSGTIGGSFTGTPVQISFEGTAASHNHSITLTTANTSTDIDPA